MLGGCYRRCLIWSGVEARLIDSKAMNDLVL